MGAAAGTGVAAATGKKDSKIESEAVLTWVAATPAAYSPATQAARQEPGFRSYGEPNRGARTYDDERGSYVFSQRDRQDIRSCLAGNMGNLPPGLAKRDRLPPGLERQVQRNGTLPPGLQKRVQPLPGVCTSRLPRLPADWVRVILGGRVLLLDPSQRIVDLFSVNQDD